jgi:hypothetical protein
MNSMQSDDLADGSVSDPSDVRQDRSDSVFVPGFWIAVALNSGVVRESALAPDERDGGAEGWTGGRWVAVTPHIAVEVNTTSQAAEAERVAALHNPAGRSGPAAFSGALHP